MIQTSARLGVQQRVLPLYRQPFFDTLASLAAGGLSVLAGLPQNHEGITPAASLERARLSQAHNLYIGKVPDCVFWQQGQGSWLDEWHPQVLVMEANLRNLSAPAAMRWMQSRRRPLIGWGLGAPVSGGMNTILWKHFLRPFDALIAYSQRGADSYIALGIPPAKVFVAPNAAVARPAQPPPERVPIFMDEHATVLYVGRLQPRKRIDLLLRACAALESRQQPRLWIVGDGPARPDLEALSRQVYPQAQFFGECHGPDLEKLFQQADIFVLPGTGGLAVQEAMSHGLPVIVAEADGTQEDIVRPENGWRLVPGDMQNLIDSLSQALSDPARLRCMGQESFRIVFEERNLESMAAAFITAVQSVFPTCLNY